MKIALLASVHKQVSSDTLGGTEMLTYYLVEELVKRGHDVTLFATSDSVTSAKLVSVCDSATANEKDGPQNLFLPYQLLLSQKAVEKSQEFDLIHNNYFETFLFSAFSLFCRVPVVHTVHNDFFHFAKLAKAMKYINSDDYYVFVSQFAHDAAGELLHKTYIHNGIDVSLFPFRAEKGDYFVWLGRLTPKKGAKEAIQAAISAGVPLKVAAAIDTKEKQEYFEKEIRPLLSDTIVFEGSLDLDRKMKLLSRAKALLAPISWDEPFGLVLVEAMACGTPVIAYKRGAVSEIIKDGRTGYIVPEGDINGLVERIKMIDTIDREQCRKHVENNFSVEKMVDGYEEIYKKILKEKI